MAVVAHVLPAVSLNVKINVVLPVKLYVVWLIPVSVSEYHVSVATTFVFVRVHDAGL